MGYYTRYLLEVDDECDDLITSAPRCIIDDVKKELGETADWIEIMGDDGWNGEPVKWYEHDDDMEKLSRKFPDVTFVLKGIGEEHYFDDDGSFRLDVWKKTYVDGRVVQNPVDWEPR